MSDDQVKPDLLPEIKVTPEEYQRMQAAAALRGMTVKEWMVATISEHVREQKEIEAHRRRHGLRVFNPNEEESA